MPIEFRYNPEKKILYGAMRSPASLEEFKLAMRDVIQSDQFPPDIRTLWDMRELDFSDIDRNFQMRLVSIRKQFPERLKARIALIVADELSFGMTRMFELLSGGDVSQHIKVFRSYSEGEEWLILDHSISDLGFGISDFKKDD